MLIIVEGNKSFSSSNYLLNLINFFYTLVYFQPSYLSLFLLLLKITFFLICLLVFITIAGTSITTSIVFSTSPFFAFIYCFSSSLGGTFEGIFRGDLKDLITILKKLNSIFLDFICLRLRSY